MVTTTNNPELVNLIGMQFHVRDIDDFEEYPKSVRHILATNALNADVFIHSIVFNADTPPDIGLVNDIDSPDDMEYYKPWQLVFSPPSGSSQPLPGGLFNKDGTLIALIHHKQI
ncbi:MAG: hypothetical protein CMQ46_05125 [Gammaproteobacteria bacterium]|nr:hypothetical protein [Gammaproteobacteria bacterium]MBJ54630.1 hypothetical protein [Gammaproteobacteria bacterium]|tara:strand:+ start:80 stop:421 length:342 start_codon:yes stop_codon:yes gene_type:complete